MSSDRRLCSCQRRLLSLLLPLVAALLLVYPSTCTASASLSSSLSPTLSSFLSLNVTSHWVVLISTSRYWFNYRHAANALSVYRIVKRSGIPDSRILLMLPDDFACSPRNGEHSASMFNSPTHSLNLYAEDDVEVDYRGAAVTVEAFLRLLTGRHTANTVKSQRLASDHNSAVLVYASGHGGNEFLKFQDQEELSAVDLASAFHAMHLQSRYAALLFVIDTCQAESMAFHFHSPNLLALSASRVGENSYSHTLDSRIGLSLIDRFTFFTLEFFEQRGSGSGSRDHGRPAIGGASVADLAQSLAQSPLLSHPVTRADLFPLPPSQVPLSLFFAAQHSTHMQRTSFHRPPASKGERKDGGGSGARGTRGGERERAPLPGAAEVAAQHASSPPATWWTLAWNVDEGGVVGGRFAAEPAAATSHRWLHLGPLLPLTLWAAALLVEGGRQPVTRSTALLT